MTTTIERIRQTDKTQKTDSYSGSCKPTIENSEKRKFQRETQHHQNLTHETKPQKNERLQKKGGNLNHTLKKTTIKLKIHTKTLIRKQILRIQLDQYGPKKKL